MQLVSKFSCKLNIERNGSRLLGPKFQNALFNVSMHESNCIFQLTISSKNTNIPLPTSPYIPRRFTHKNIKKIGKQCIQEGKLSLTLINYSANLEGYTVYSNPPILTCIYISEAPIEALLHFLNSLLQGPNKRDAIEVIQEREDKRSKPQQNMWSILNFDVIQIIFAFVNEDIGKFGLVSRKWNLMIGELSKALKFRYAKDVPGEIVIRTIKRHPHLKKINLKDCRNLQISHIKKAITLPLRSLKYLNLENCKKVNSQALFSMILNAPRLLQLNIINTAIDDTFFMDLNPKIHLKVLEGLSLSSLTSQGAQHLSSKCLNLTQLEIHLGSFTAQIAYNLLKLDKLVDLKIYYQQMEAIPSVKINQQFKVVEILPTEHILPCKNSFELWDSFASCDLVHLGCNLNKENLIRLLPFWKNLKSVRVCEYFCLPENVKIISMYNNEDFEYEIKHADGEKWMQNVKKFEVIMQRLDFMKSEAIKDYFKKYYPGCKLNITSN